jgi:hypothetical protein
MKIITQKDKENINKLYLELGTYAAVSRATGFSPGTVKKYVNPNYSIVDESKIIRYSRESLPDFEPERFRNRDWGELCELSQEEIEGIYLLWKEMSL